jgi:diaminopropionate ammonia-lyase family
MGPIPWTDRLTRWEASLSHSYVLTDPRTIYYLVGYVTPGPAFVALVRGTTRALTLVVRDLESTNARDDVALTVRTYAEDDPTDLFAELLQGCQVIGYDADSTQCTPRQMAAIRNHAPHAWWIDLSSEARRLRLRKTDEEVACVRAASAYVTQAYRAALAGVRVGMTEVELAALLSYGKLAAGSEWTSYPDFVSTGTNGLKGHHAASRTRLRDGDVVFLEVGASHDRYHAARMHTFYLGNDPPVWFYEMEACLRRAVRGALAVCRRGALCRDVDRVMRDVVEEGLWSTGIDGWMQRRSGYSIGIGVSSPDWADGAVRLNPTSTESLEEGMVLHLIPWIQVRDVGGLGWSDTVVIGSSGATSLFESELPASVPTAVHVYHHHHHSSLVTPRVPVTKSLPPPPSPPRHVLPPPSPLPPPLPLTPLVHVEVEKGVHLYLKDERNHNGARSFKIRGVAHAVRLLEESGTLQPGDTVATMSDGNHGEALSWVARQRGYTCHVLVPRNVSAERIQVLRNLGAVVTEVDGTYDECIAQLQLTPHVVVADTAWEGYTQVPASIARGYADLFDEALGQMPSPPTHAFVQAGVGTLLTAACDTLPPTTRIVCVEPVDAACLYENVRAGRTKETLRPCSGTTDSVMQGLNCGTPSVEGYDRIARRVDDFVCVGDEWACRAMRWLHCHDLDAGATGAASMAGVLAAGDRVGASASGASVLVLITEGVTDSAHFATTMGSE